MRAPSIGFFITLLALQAGCGDSEGDGTGGAGGTGMGGTSVGGGGAGTGGGGADANQCGLGPIEIPSVGTGESCDATPRCPASRPEGAAFLVSVASCGLASGETECAPIVVPDCPAGGHQDLQFSVVNSNQPEACFSDLLMEIVPTPDGGASVTWTAVEKDPDTCAPLGPELTGSLDIPGPCCAVQQDVHYPGADFWFRFEVQTDWQ